MKKYFKEELLDISCNTFLPCNMILIFTAINQKHSFMCDKHFQGEKVEDLFLKHFMKLSKSF